MRNPHYRPAFLPTNTMSRAVLSLPVFALLLASPALQAQAKAASPASATPTDLSMDVSENCPVALFARRWGQGGGVEAVQKGQPNAYAPHLLLHFDSLRWLYGSSQNVATPQSSGARPVAPGRTVVSATVIVQGFGYEKHADPEGGREPSARTQTLHLTNAVQEVKGYWKLDPDQVPFASEIDIAEMQFSDGTSWKEARAAHCYVAVSGFTLVDASAR